MIKQAKDWAPLTTRNYNWLVENRPEYMQGPWLKLERKWWLCGVEVSGEPAQISELFAQFKTREGEMIYG